MTVAERTSDPDDGGPDLEYGKAMSRAMKILTARDRSRGEITLRLVKIGFSGGVVEKVCDRLEELGFLNDRKFALEQVRRAGLKGLSEKATAFQLKAKGVPAGDVIAALDQAGGGMGEADRALAAARRRAARMSGLAPGVAERRLMAFLSRRGYDWEVAADACRKLLSEVAEGD